ncbi:MAG: hypothetical protein AAF963_02455, partial [Bacteroidota bacterium]
MHYKISLLAFLFSGALLVTNCDSKKASSPPKTVIAATLEDDTRKTSEEKKRHDKQVDAPGVEDIQAPALENAPDLIRRAQTELGGFAPRGDSKSAKKVYKKITNPEVSKETLEQLLEQDGRVVTGKLREAIKCAMKDAVSRKKYRTSIGWNFFDPNNNIAQFIQIAINTCNNLHSTIHKKQLITDSQIQVL